MSDIKIIEAEVVPVAPATPVASSSRRQDVAVRDFIKPSLIRYPMYDYKTGLNWHLSKTEQIVVDSYLETSNVTEACRTLNAIYQSHGSTRRFTPNAVSRWLRKPHVARYIAEKFIDRGKVNWFDIAKWEAWGVDVLQGKPQITQVQVAIWKEYGKAKGWYKETGPSVMHNTQINFVQSDGKA